MVIKKKTDLIAFVFQISTVLIRNAHTSKNLFSYFKKIHIYNVGTSSLKKKLSNFKLLSQVEFLYSLFPKAHLEVIDLD